MFRFTRLVVLGLGVFCGAAAGADFSFFATLQVGQSGAAGYELGVGATSATVQGDYFWNAGVQHWAPGGLDQDFRIGYNQATNSSYVTVYTQLGAANTVSFSNPGPQMAANATWTIPASSFFATATGQSPDGIGLSNLSFSSGVTVLSGSLPTSLGATAPTGAGGTTTNTLSGPIQITATGAGGDWYIQGQIRFTGIGGGSAPTGSQLALALSAAGTDAPESSTYLLMGIGLILTAAVSRKRAAVPVRKG